MSIKYLAHTCLNLVCLDATHKMFISDELGCMYVTSWMASQETVHHNSTHVTESKLLMT